MVIKDIDNKEKDFKKLETLKKIAPDSQARIIQNNLLSKKKGYKNEKDVAYIINYEFKDKKYTDILHDIRLKHNGKTAQIDHILINVAGIYVIESKFIGNKVTIDENGDWYIYKKNGKKLGIKSPIEQNQRHITLLEDILKDYQLLPKRLGFVVKVPIYNLVVLSTNCIIDGKIPKNVIKFDKIKSKVFDIIDEESKKYLMLNSIKLSLNLLTRNEVRYISDTLKKLHKPTKPNYEKIYNLNNHDEELYEKLRLERNKFLKANIENEKLKISNEKLKIMSNIKPKNPEEFKNIEGITEEIFKKYGYKLLNIILVNRQ
jgi:superfamily II DNA helicase RecQ